MGEPRVPPFAPSFTPLTPRSAVGYAGMNPAAPSDPLTRPNERRKA